MAAMNEDNQFHAISYTAMEQESAIEAAQEQVHTMEQRSYENCVGSYYFCAQCDKSYISVEDYIQCHKINDEEISLNDLIEYDATEEQQQSDENNQFVTDVKVEEDSNKYFCYDCRTVFKELEEAEGHDCQQIELKETTQGDDEPAPETLLEFTCAFCEINFEDFAKLEQHQVSCIKYTRNEPKPAAANSNTQPNESEEQPATNCNICNIEFGSNKRLKLHMKIHAEQPIRSIQQVLPDVAKKEYSRLDHFFCELCNKSFDQNLLFVHKKMHQEAASFVCKLCNRQFENAESYEVHQQRHKSRKDNDSTSSSISTGPTEAMLRNAKNGIRSTHVDNAKQTYPCQYCGHVFWRPFEKTRHERVHTGERPYACEICGKTFRVPYSLTLHLRTHTNVRPFVCSTCNKRFKSQSVYTHHLRTHLNERPYSCQICEKSFRTLVQMNAHKDSHTKPFNCTTCNRPFASLHAVKAHMKSQHKNEMLENNATQHACNICGAVYARVVFLRAHLKERHGVELPTIANKNAIYERDVEDDYEIAADDSGSDNVAALLISAAADAEAREQQEHNTPENFTTICDNEEAELIIGQEYLPHELTLDSFSAEETVVTRFEV